jgi:hypothetical protein
MATSSYKFRLSINLECLLLAEAVEKGGFGRLLDVPFGVSRPFVFVSG